MHNLCIIHGDLSITFAFAFHWISGKVKDEDVRVGIKVIVDAEKFTVNSELND